MSTIKEIIKNNWDILLSDTALAPVFSEPPQFTVKRAPTLKDKLVKNYISPPKPTTFLVKPTGTFQCGACRHCPHINKSTTFMNNSWACTKSFQCKHFANCNTTHVIYRLDCKCGCFYIGLTKRRLRGRFGEHKYAIKTKNLNYPIAKHFGSSTQCNPNDLAVMVIEVVQKSIRGGDRLRTLAQRESYWIDTLQAVTFPGLNEELDFSVFLWGKNRHVHHAASYICIPCMTCLFLFLFFWVSIFICCQMEWCCDVIGSPDLKTFKYTCLAHLINYALKKVVCDRNASAMSQI